MAAEAAVAVAAVRPVSAQVVANAFVQQYYHILHHSPGLVFRFYQDISKLGRPEEDGSMGITTTMQAINDKILSLNYGDFRAEIKSVDAQESFNGGVHVLVTGYLTGKDNLIRDFCQTFFLAPQDRGYFVLNDMFRYIETAGQHDTVQVPVPDAVAPGEIPKSSYASIVMHLKESAATFSPPPAPAPRKPMTKSVVQVNQPAATATDGPYSSSDTIDSINDTEADGYSIYIKGLPMSATVALLADEFKKFGPIKNGGIQVRSNRQQGFCFGFVEFEVESAVQKAIEASPILIGDRQAVVEEKRSTNSRVNTRGGGRFQSGRGGGFRNDVWRKGSRKLLTWQGVWSR